MSNQEKTPHDEFDQPGDAWSEMGLGGDDAHQQGNAGHTPEDTFVDNENTSNLEGATHLDEEVLDVEAAPKKKSKAGIYAAIGVVVLIALVIVWMIFSKMMAVMSPPKGGDQVVSTPAGDIRPLEAVQQEPVVALPGGAVPSQSDAPAPQASAPIAAEPVSAQTAVVAPPASPVQAAPAAACAPTAAAVCADTSAKDREISSLKDDLNASKAKLAELESKAKKPAATKPAQAARVASGQNKIVRGKFNEQKPEVAPAPEKTAAVVQPVTAPAVTASPVAPVEKKDPSGLSNFRLRAIYPNTGEYKAAHLVDPAGKNVVVRVGDSLRTGARVTAINVDDWRVITTEGDIR